MRKTQFGTLAAAGMALAALSCGGPQEPSPGTFDAQPVLVTDRLEYTAVPLGPPGPYRQWEFTLQATLTNPSSRPLYVNRCTPDSAEPTYGVASVPADAGESAYNVGWACFGHDRPIVVGPGRTRVDRLVLRAPNGWSSGGGEPIGVLSGRVQLVYIVSGCRGFNPCPIGPVSAVSNAFDIATPQ